MLLSLPAGKTQFTITTTIKALWRMYTQINICRGIMTEAKIDAA